MQARKKMTLGIVGVLAVALAFALLPASKAHAAQPVTQRHVDDFTITLSCSGGELLFRQIVRETDRAYYDADGSWIRQATFIQDVVTLTDPNTGESFSATWTWGLTFLPDSVSTVGLTARVTIPGEGLVAIDTGRIVFDRATGQTIFDRGPSDYPNLCRVFS